jgi:hypothetical protein
MGLGALDCELLPVVPCFVPLSATTKVLSHRKNSAHQPTRGTLHLCRIYLPDGSNVLLNLLFVTADTATARARASALSAMFEQIKARLRESEGWKLSLNALQMTAVYKLELEAKLGCAMAETFTANNMSSALLDSRLHHKAWSATQAPHKPSELTAAHEYCLAQLGLD